MTEIKHKWTGLLNTDIITRVQWFYFPAKFNEAPDVRFFFVVIELFFTGFSEKSLEYQYVSYIQDDIQVPLDWMSF